MELTLPEPERLVCDACGSEWWSRMAHRLAADADLGRCVRCGGRLVLARPVVDLPGAVRGPEPEPEAA